MYMEMDIYQIHLIPIDAPFSFLLNAPSSASEITLHAELFSEAPSPCRGQRCRVGFLPPWFIILNPIHIRFGPDAAARFGVEVRGRCSSMGASSRRRSQGARRSSRRWAAAAMLEQLVPLLISRCMLYLAKAVRECEIKVSLFVALPNMRRVLLIASGI
jgi:hypothetical protein